MLPDQVQEGLPRLLPLAAALPGALGRASSSLLPALTPLDGGPGTVGMESVALPLCRGAPLAASGCATPAAWAKWLRQLDWLLMSDQVMSKVMETFQPSAVALQCGSDSLSGDRLGCFNLTIKGEGRGLRLAQVVGPGRLRALPELCVGSWGQQHQAVQSAPHRSFAKGFWGAQCALVELGSVAPQEIQRQAMELFCVPSASSVLRDGLLQAHCLGWPACLPAGHGLSKTAQPPDALPWPLPRRSRQVCGVHQELQPAHADAGRRRLHDSQRGPVLDVRDGGGTEH